MVNFNEYLKTYSYARLNESIVGTSDFWLTHTERKGYRVINVNGLDIGGTHAVCSALTQLASQAPDGNDTSIFLLDVSDPGSQGEDIVTIPDLNSIDGEMDDMDGLYSMDGCGGRDNAGGSRSLAMQMASSPGGNIGLVDVDELVPALEELDTRAEEEWIDAHDDDDDEDDDQPWEGHTYIEFFMNGSSETYPGYPIYCSEFNSIFICIDNVKSDELRTKWDSGAREHVGHPNGASILEAQANKTIQPYIDAYNQMLNTVQSYGEDTTGLHPISSTTPIGYPVEYYKGLRRLSTAYYIHELNEWSKSTGKKPSLQMVKQIPQSQQFRDAVKFLPYGFQMLMGQIVDDVISAIDVDDPNASPDVAEMKSTFSPKLKAVDNELDLVKFDFTPGKEVMLISMPGNLKQDPFVGQEALDRLEQFGISDVFKPTVQAFMQKYPQGRLLLTFDKTNNLI